jgi:hypothetical protein
VFIRFFFLVTGLLLPAARVKRVPPTLQFQLETNGEVVTVTAAVRQPDFVGSSLNLLMQL